VGATKRFACKRELPSSSVFLCGITTMSQSQLKPRSKFIAISSLCFSSPRNLGGETVIVRPATAPYHAMSKGNCELWQKSFGLVVQ
jgi:hypothetical protein